jgi:hypothetical protein
VSGSPARAQHQPERAVAQHPLVALGHHELFEQDAGQRLVFG